MVIIAVPLPERETEILAERLTPRQTGGPSEMPPVVSEMALEQWSVTRPMHACAHNTRHVR